MNVTVNGVAQNEDVDYFEINATQGQRIVEIEAIRLSGPLFDPYVAILDENRFEIATSDDSELLLQDSTTSVIAPKTGKYYVEVRESSYRGGSSYQACTHRLFSPAQLLLQLEGKPENPSNSLSLGDPKGPVTKTITLPNDGRNILAYHHEENGLRTPVQIIFVFPNFLPFLKSNQITHFRLPPRRTLSSHSHLMGSYKRTEISIASAFRLKRETATTSKLMPDRSHLRLTPC